MDAKKKIFKKKVEWRIVAGTEGHYSVSNTGLVRRNTATSKYLGNKILRASSNGRDGKYPSVCLCLNGCPRTANVHRLVAIAFIPNPDNKPQVNHINGDTFNNNVSNLEWVTNSENNKHAYSKLGREVVRGSRIGMAKLHETTVAAIRERMREGARNLDITAEFGIDNCSASLIRHRHIWRHVP